MSMGVRATVSRLRPEDMAEILMLPSWGRVRRENPDRLLGYSRQIWQELYDSGYQEEPEEAPPPPISEDHADLLDREILKLERDLQKTLIALYVRGKSLNAAPRVLGKSRHAVIQDRDAAINRLYGALVQ